MVPEPARGVLGRFKVPGHKQFILGPVDAKGFMGCKTRTVKPSGDGDHFSDELMLTTGQNNAKRARFGLPVSKMRGAALFLDLAGRLYKMSRVMCALKLGRPGARRESVKGGGRDALNGVWERCRKQR